MANQVLTKIEQEMVDNYASIKLESDALVKSLNGEGKALEGIDDIKAKICSVWSKIKPFIGLLEKIPLVGRYVTILASLLDALCAS